MLYSTTVMNGTAKKDDVLGKYKLDSVSHSYNPGQEVEMRGGNTQENIPHLLFVSVAILFSIHAKQVPVM